ncbi:MFS transporter [Actinobacteria bacterium YIM 96077]|uniref:MFS transporter n=1 Tax=Phytoactinopolyspora halophila TaxID=1981511 RepID=A0A329QAH9_9ACTN|nr:MFS transporter [Phytoactinopolyspora halophila]AYY13971.1 MFS transporter [Actinobacteria bacterium YIM 96077]RAW09410.1 MFS transporter [Phytoactinopolyspora halophila]
MTLPVSTPTPARNRRPLFAWAIWDWGSQAFNTIILTFVFTVYLTDAVATDPDSGSQALGTALTIAGAIVAVLAPVTGQRSDASGRRKLWLAVHSIIVIVCMAALFFVRPDPSYLLLGLALIALASIFSEFAGVNYNAMLMQVSTRETIGRVSGFGWGMGYFGGLVALVAVLFAFVQPDVGLFGVTSDDGMDIRAVAVFCAAWFAVFALPLFFFVPEAPASGDAPRRNIIASYVVLGKRIARMWRNERRTLWFLGASAIYRDGLAAVFTFAGVIAAGTFGFSSTEVIIFAIAANLTAGLGAIFGGRVDDRLGPKTVIVGGLASLLVVGVAITSLEGAVVFWVGGLILATFVGPIQSASRTFLARLTRPGLEGEAFGLYATMGRAVSFAGPLAFSGFISIFGTQRAGMAGIVLVLFLGLVAVLGVRPPGQAPRTADDAGSSPLPG